MVLGGCKVRQEVPGLVEYQCAEKKTFYVDYGENFSAAKLPAKAIIHFEDKAVSIPQAPDGKGIRFSDGLTTFTAEGDTASLITRGGSYERCQIVR
jgi:membrane-bound inhibitor of C-type lysozyme